MCHEPRDIRNEYSSNFIEYPEHVFIGLDRDNGACILKLSIMDNQILKQWNTQKHTSTVSQKKKKSIPAQLGAPKLLMHQFHQYHRYLEHHDYHKYTQSPLYLTWMETANY